MGTADVAATAIFSAMALICGAALLYTWVTIDRPDSEHLLGVPMMSTIAGVGAFSVVMVITSLAGLPAWLRVLLALLAGAVTGVSSRNLWHDRNALVISARNKVRDQPASDGQEN
ncbi:MAG TPA: hypothetical protein VJT31_34985 [Rugosimonospora sp.]|nr:hypothetical protein [Rugosimonospora sp.]